MFGTEKQKPAAFEFDLEKDIHKDRKKGEEILKRADGCINEIKQTLRAGTDLEELDELGVLLHGYAALYKVIGKVTKRR